MARAKLTDEEKWHHLLHEGHAAKRRARAVFGRIPSEPRCKMCQNPFGGLGGKVFSAAGFKPSRKNPRFCTRCCDVLPEGGAEVDCGVVFADVRGSTAIAESMSSSEFATLLNGFYRTATRVFVEHDAIIDKLIGDEVMAFFVPGVAGSDYRSKTVDAALALARAASSAQGEDAALEVGVGVHVGTAFVGNVGTDGVVDFTALGDTVNTASRLQHHAAAGEVVLSADAYGSGRGLPEVEAELVSLDGKSDPLPVHVIGV